MAHVFHLLIQVYVGDLMSPILDLDGNLDLYSHMFARFAVARVIIVPTIIRLDYNGSYIHATFLWLLFIITMINRIWCSSIRDPKLFV